VVKAANLVSSGGLIYSDAPAGSSSYVVLRDENATQKGSLYWDRASNTTIIKTAVAAEALAVETAGRVKLGIGFAPRSGVSGAYQANNVNISWGPNANLWIDTVNLGVFQFVCDYRLKKDIVPLASTWDAVKALKPISYTQAEFTPSSEKAARVKEAAALREADPKAELPVYTPMFAADDIERWGFIAHELQETLLPTAAGGTKDSPNEVQSPNMLAIIAALTKALQEAMGRIEALEATVLGGAPTR
jgi:hypothetical protein